MCTILQQTNKQTNKQTYHKKDFCLSYCNFLQQSLITLLPPTSPYP